MLWEVEISPLQDDQDTERVRLEAEYDLLGYPRPPEGELLWGTARGYLLEGDITLEQASRVMNEVLVDPLVERAVCNPVPLGEGPPRVVECTVFPEPVRSALRRVLANVAIDHVSEGPLGLDHLTLGAPYVLRLIPVLLRDRED